MFATNKDRLLQFKSNNHQNKQAMTNEYVSGDSIFSFKYPDDWKVVETKDYLRLEISPKDYNSESSVIFITSTENPSNLPLEDLEKKNTGFSGMGPGLFSKDNISVTNSNGVKGFFSEKVACEPFGCYSYIIPVTGKVYTIRSSMKEVVDNQKEVLDQIFDSFKITQ